MCDALGASQPRGGTRRPIPAQGFVRALCVAVAVGSTVLCRCDDPIRRGAGGSAGRLPDLVLIDLHMPRLDGLGALQIMRARRHMRTVPTIGINNNFTSG